VINLRTSQALLRDNLIQIGQGTLPFKDNSFDLVLSLDYLEHLDNDDLCLKEIRRVLKKNGLLILAIPQTGKCFFIHKIRPFLGITLEDYGHKRDGYALKEIQKKLGNAGLVYHRHKNFSRFFTEFIELLLNVLYMRIFKPKKDLGLRDGHIRPATPEEFASKKCVFRLYTFVYPLIWLVTRLDGILFFIKGYALMVWAKKNK
jgi:SAM-dependent methyltransferase